VSSLGSVLQENDIMHVNLFFDGLSFGALLTFKTGPPCIVDRALVKRRQSCTFIAKLFGKKIFNKFLLLPEISDKNRKSLISILFFTTLLLIFLENQWHFYMVFKKIVLVFSSDVSFFRYHFVLCKI